MFNKIKQLFTGSELKNPMNLTSDEIKTIERDLAGFNQYGAGIAQKALQYIVDGENVDVLDEVSKLNKAGSALKLIIAGHYYSNADIDERVAVLSKLQRHSPTLLLRVAEVYEAASRSERQSPGPLQRLGAPQWLAGFVLEVTGLSANVWPRKVKHHQFRWEFMESMLQSDANGTDIAMRCALLVEPGDWRESIFSEAFSSLLGFDQAFIRHSVVVNEALSSAAAIKINALTLMRKVQAPLAPFVDGVIALAVGSAKTVRKAAEPLVLENAAIALPALKTLAGKGASAEREFALTYM
jgi:hypothetical protein